MRVAKLGQAMAQERKFFDYYQQFHSDTKEGYNAKLNIVNVHINDPYTFTPENAGSIIPDIQYPDIYNYIPHQHSQPIY